MSFAVSDLRERPEFFAIVADRIWRAWWKADGVPLEHISERLRENLSDTQIPLAIVAHDAAKFLGMASVIASDLVERPQLTPWVAAVWVDPPARRRGVGAILVDRASQLCFAAGFNRIHLCARPELSGFYERLGWVLYERDVGARRLNIFFRDAARTTDRLSSSP